MPCRAHSSFGLQPPLPPPNSTALRSALRSTPLETQCSSVIPFLHAASATPVKGIARGIAPASPVSNMPCQFTDESSQVSRGEVPGPHRSRSEARPHPMLHSTAKGAACAGRPHVRSDGSPPLSRTSGQMAPYLSLARQIRWLPFLCLARQIRWPRRGATSAARPRAASSPRGAARPRGASCRSSGG